jgi:hypothetical protein
MLLFSWLAACDQASPPAPKTAPASPPVPGVHAKLETSGPSVRFVERAGEAGLTLLNTSGAPGAAKRYTLETIGTGAALLDYDGDGLLDVFLVNGCELENHKPVRGGGSALYRNLGGMRFEDVTEKAHARVDGMGFGALAQDFDNDGHTDLFITRWDTNVLLRNNGNGTYTDVSAASGLVVQDRWSTSAAALDYDLDGDLDIYVGTYFSMGALDPEAWDKLKCDYNGLQVICGPKGMVPEPDFLWRNDGKFLFHDVSAASGILDVPPSYGLGVLSADFDQDGFPDVYVANDSMANNLFHNEGTTQLGKFRDIALDSGVAYSADGRAQAGMGVTAGDYDGDGRLDLFVTNFALDYNTLYHSEDGGLYEDISRALHFGQYQYLALAWGTGFVDLDLDRDLDLFVAAGHVYAEADQRKPEQFYRQHNMVFLNNGKGDYEDVSDRAGPGLQIEDVHRGAAFGDLDNDGDVDVVVMVLNGKPQLLVNESEKKGSYLLISLRAKSSNRDGVGTKVWVEVDGVTLFREAMSGNSFLSSNDPRLHVGLGTARNVSLKVRWPSRIETTYEHIEPNSWIRVEEGAPEVIVVSKH